MSCYVRKTYSQPLYLGEEVKKDLLEFFTPQTHDSTDYKNWISTLSLTTCQFCRGQHGKIYLIYEIIEVEPPVHDRCKCVVAPMKAVYFGNATKDGQNGADVYRNKNGHLPSASGRVWYEADINYDTGYRNHHRLLYSNDGLIFATYDHYITFVQIH